MRIFNLNGFKHPTIDHFCYCQLQLSNIVLVHLIFNIWLKSHTASLFYTSHLITFTPTTWNMAKPQMTRELVGLEVEFASVDINSSNAIHSKLRNKSQIPDTAKKITYYLHKPIIISMMMRQPLNLHLPLRDSSKLINLSDDGQNSTRIWCYFHCL